MNRTIGNKDLEGDLQIDLYDENIQEQDSILDSENVEDDNDEEEAEAEIEFQNT